MNAAINTDSLTALDAPVHCTRCGSDLDDAWVQQTHALQKRLGKPQRNPKVCAACVIDAIMSDE